MYISEEKHFLAPLLDKAMRHRVQLNKH